MNRLLTAAAMLSMSAGLAAAQCCEKSGGCTQDNGGSRTSELSVTTPATGAQRATGVLSLAGAQPEAKVQSHTVMIQKDGDHECKVDITNGEVKAWVDGERVPTSRVKVGDNSITVVDEGGKTIAEFQYQKGGVPGHPSARAGDKDDGPIVWESEEARGDGGRAPMMFFQSQGEHPPVMIGINMNPLNPDEAGDGVIDYLDEKGIDPDNVIVVLSVIDGLPADEAGVRDGDVVVRVDGNWGVNADKLREVLKDKGPGDTIELGVLRKGKFREIDVKLAPWDASKLGAAYPGLQLEEQSGTPFQWQSQNGDKLRELLRQFGDENKDLKVDGGELEKQIRALVEGMKKDGTLKNFQFDVMPRIQRFHSDDENGEHLLIQPAPRDQAIGDLRDRMDRMEERLDRIEGRLDRILKALEHDSE